MNRDDLLRRLEKLERELGLETRQRGIKGHGTVYQRKSDGRWVFRAPDVKMRYFRSQEEAEQAQKEYINDN